MVKTLELKGQQIRILQRIIKEERESKSSEINAEDAESEDDNDFLKMDFARAVQDEYMRTVVEGSLKSFEETCDLVKMNGLSTADELIVSFF